MGLIMRGSSGRITCNVKRRVKNSVVHSEVRDPIREVARVLYPALPDDPGHAIWKRDFTGASGLLGFILDRPYRREALAAMLDGMKHFAMGESWGGYESLLLPRNPTPLRTATSWSPPGPLLRAHVGLENADDLIADLEAGFARLEAAA